MAPAPARGLLGRADESVETGGEGLRRHRQVGTTVILGGLRESP
jgi:hypothetical protein